MNLTITQDRFFQNPASETDEFIEIIRLVCREQKRLEVSLKDDDVEITLTEYDGDVSLVLTGARFSDFFDAELKSTTPNIFLPLVVDIKKIVLPHCSLINLGRNAQTPGNIIVRNVYSHLLRKLPCTIKNSGGANLYFSRQYFYFLRWMFSDSFPNRQIGFEKTISNMLFQSCSYPDPFLEASASRLRKEAATGVEKTMLKRQLTQLSNIRGKLMSII